jgi:hypothetical protein
MSNALSQIVPFSGSDIRKLGVPRVISNPKHFNELVDRHVARLFDNNIPVTLHAITLYLGFVSLKDFELYPKHKGEQFQASVDRTKYIAEFYLVNEIASSDKPESGKQFILKAVHGFAEKQEIEMKAFNVNIDGKDVTC